MAPVENGVVTRLLPADCLAIEEIGASGAVFDILAFIMLLTTSLFMAFKAVRADPGVRPFYYINTFVCLVAAFAYFSMIAGMGWETIMGCRQFFYVRYIDWAVTLPLLTLDLGLLAGQDLVTVSAIAGANMMMVTAGYLGAVALVPTVKWLWFLIAIITFVPVVFAVVRIFRQSVIDSNDVDKIELYGKVSLLTIVVWSLYPVVWMLGTGVGAFGISAESICYAVLDVISKCVFSFMIVNMNVYESAAAPVHKEYV
mmetsp:Transcript_14256/g.28172  ORF Transcript_14256/g.28172 Transcript_14256/m.28172 type:complete len:256 (-) Transcript_14256:106-873(-)|eukprot:CAMPEP_0173392910 /NCGR_PEP_ID=MMETSP1356-20130122/21738_1 /TAXON_ID=77927 ORGANISM="Hemiselmis virescens, Strain PCC157" /NCGR_SAMPLE_ID=MMETSP1356 /ASSEMBLY_ACC=CAM_ASM_000847 /LENGTH=255 /DNA_ID=CAMNT_0014350843 /DNA_START=69 /DNA_END=836 /DNA_ORIENTATION=+